MGGLRFWYAPSLLWYSSTSPMLMALCWVGMIASVLLVLNLWPRGMLAIAFVCFLEIAASEDAMRHGRHAEKPFVLLA